MLLQEHSSCLCHGENGKPFCLAELWPALIVRIHWDFTINAVHAFQEKKNFGFTNASSTCSFPLHGRPNILLVNYDSWWQHQMSVRELRHDRPSGWFSKSRGLSASVSFLSSPPPPRSFTYAIFRAVFDSCSSLFAPKRTIQTIKKLKKMLFLWRVNLADQNKQQPQEIKTCITYHTWPLSMKQTFDRHMSILFD